MMPMHQHELRTKVYTVKRNVAAKNLGDTILRWENRVKLFEEACAHDTMSEANMCPDRLRDYLQTHGVLRFAICDAHGDLGLAGQGAGAARCTPRVAVLEPQRSEEEDGEVKQREGQDWAAPELNDDAVDALKMPQQAKQSPNAIVKNFKTKQAKGGGKGGTGCKNAKPRTCFEYEAEDHAAANCPARAARVANGWLERLEDPLGRKRRKKPSKQWQRWQKSDVWNGGVEDHVHQPELCSNGCISISS